MARKVKHMGMTLTEEEHKKWHEEHPDLSPKEHKKLMQKMGISKEQDKKWHEEHEAPQESPKKSREKPINCFAVGGGFLAYCVRRGWLIQEGKGRGIKYYATEKGRKELKGFNIEI